MNNAAGEVATTLGLIQSMNSIFNYEVQNERKSFTVKTLPCSNKFAPVLAHFRHLKTGQ